MTTPIFTIDNPVPRKRHPALVFFTIAVLLILAAIVKVLYAPNIPIGQNGIIQIRADDLPRLIRTAEGQPVVVLLYSSQCPRCADIFPAMVQLHDTHMHNINFFVSTQRV